MKSTIEAVLAVLLLAGPATAGPVELSVTATAETEATAGDADDPAIWVDPAAPERARILGTDKQVGLRVYDLTGRLVQDFPDGHLNNVDLRPFTLGGRAVWLVGAGSWRFRALLWLDAIGLAAYGVLGAAKAEAFGVPALICIVMGALTACFGGVVRDLLAGQPSILLRREITVSAALLAATLFVGMRALGLDPWPAAIAASAAGFALRAGALVWGWSLPAFPGRAS